MTISSTLRRAGPFAGNGVATSFPFGFKVFSKTDLTVLTADTSGGAQVQLVLDSDYSVTLNADQNTNPGGSVTYPIVGNPMTSARVLAMIGGLLNTQPTDLTNNGGFYPSVIEDMGDRSTIQIQQLAEAQTRTLAFPATDDPSRFDATIPTAPARTNKMLGFDQNGDPTVLVPASGSAADVLIQLALGSGSSGIGYQAPYLGAVYLRLSDLLSDLPVSVKIFGAKGDGLADDSSAIIEWLAYLGTFGRPGWVPAGTYMVETAVLATLSASIDIKCSTNAQFVAASGFPAGVKLFNIETGIGTGFTFKWLGGRFDGTNIPNSAAGQANDIFGFTATNAGHVHIDLDQTISGADWLNSGSDSHLFIGGGDTIIANIGECIGAMDAGIYISRDINATLGGSLRATGNFSKCSTCLIVKREFERAYLQANTVDCVNGIGAGTAQITGVPLSNGGKNFTLIVNATRTENAAFLQAMQGANVMITSTDIGVSIPGHTSTVAAGLHIQGSSAVGGTVVATGVNPACASNANFNAVRTEAFTITAGTLQSTDNMLSVVSTSVGRPVREADSSDRNAFTVHDFGSASIPTLVGPNSTYVFGDGTGRYVTNGIQTQIAKTFATLPTSPRPGDRCFISDATVSTFRAPVTTGGGTLQVFVYFSAGVWIVG